MDGGGGLITGTDSRDYSQPDADDEPAPANNGAAPPVEVEEPRLPTLPRPLRVLPLGDSITQGNTSHDSYRRPLWQMMDRAEYDFDFVGAVAGNNGGAPPHDDFDADNQGHWGYRADQVLALLPNALRSYTPDVVLMHLGSNDAFQGQSTQSTLAELRNIVSALRADNANVIVLIAELIPTTNTADAKAVNAINLALPALVASLNTAASPVVLVDQAAGFDPNELTYDGVHPNNEGEGRIAAIWMNAIVDLGTQ